MTIEHPPQTKHHYLIDTNVLAWLYEQSPLAINFATAPDHQLYIDAVIHNEFLAWGVSIQATQQVTDRYTIQLLAAANDEVLTKILNTTGRAPTTPQRMNDLRIIASAKQHHLIFVTGDLHALKTAIVAGVNVLPAFFAVDVSDQTRQVFYTKANRILHKE